MKNFSIIFIGILFCSTSSFCEENGKTEHLLVLQNSRVTIGILPKAGGRIVLFKRTGHEENILLSDPSLWKAEPRTKDEDKLNTPFIPYNGHIIWIGPQEKWWTDQNVDPVRKNKKAVWPPDPFTIYDHYTVKEKTGTSIIMTGTTSKVSGLRLTREIHLEEEGRIHIKTTAINCRNRNVTWDLWSLTRIPTNMQIYIPLAENEKTGFELKPEQISSDSPLHIWRQDNALVFTNNHKPPKGTDFGGKVFVHSKQGRIISFLNDIVFIKQTTPPEPGMVYPKHAAIEIFCRISDNENKAMFELEFHSACRTLKPGEGMSQSETWQLIPYTGNGTTEARIAFLKKNRLISTD